MSSKQGFYSIIQFSPVPDRFEFINIGVVLVAPGHRFYGVRFSKGMKRIEKLFGKQQGSYLASLKEGLRNRLEVELSRDFSRERFEKFAESRANEIRISKPLPLLVDQPEADLEDLFHSLVGEAEVAMRGPNALLAQWNKFCPSTKATTRICGGGCGAIPVV